MPDWTYHTFLRPLLPRLPRGLLRAWGASRLGRGIVRFLADAEADPRIGARASADTEGIVRELGVGFVQRDGPAVADPGEAVRAIEAHGQVVLDLARGGPGLPRRVHEAVTPPRAEGRRWGVVLLGLGMIAAGLGAWVVAATRVVLPYDEAFVEVPDALLPFLAHDRITLAGTMVSIGILYAAVGWFAGGAAWARRAVTVSAGVGFASFWLFLAFGYFDPLHAAISATLLPFFLWGVWHRSRGGSLGVRDLANDRAWRLAQWGTLGFVVLGVGLVGGGVAIAIVGSTSVFVASDLAFIGPLAMEPRLVALVAHDRAGFGGALASNGLLVLLVALGGIRRGASWLWWTFLAAGAVGFGAALGVHVAVGYIDAMHLSPVVLAVAIFVPSLAALRGYMRSDPGVERHGASQEHEA